jgi:hypothetical protein
MSHATQALMASFLNSVVEFLRLAIASSPLGHSGPIVQPPAAADSMIDSEVLRAGQTLVASLATGFLLAKLLNVALHPVRGQAV